MTSMAMRCAKWLTTGNRERIEQETEADDAVVEAVLRRFFESWPAGGGTSGFAVDGRRARLSRVVVSYRSMNFSSLSRSLLNTSPDLPIALPTALIKPQRSNGFGALDPGSGVVKAPPPTQGK
jgi:hypothetical protein